MSTHIAWDQGVGSDVAGFSVFFRKGEWWPWVLYGSGYSLEEADRVEAELRFLGSL